MTSTRRQIQYENTREEIKAIAWTQIAAGGAPALSLGGIARQMGLTTPALYRYFPSREDLLDALSREAYASFAGALDSARSALPPDDHAGRFRVLCLAYHQWAVAHPQQYNLIFGVTPPGYQLVGEAGQLADRSFLIVLEVVQAAEQAGKLNISTGQFPLTPGLQAQLESLQQQGGGYSAWATYLALISWSFMHGVTSLELNQRYALILGEETEEFVQLEISRFMRSIGLE